MEQQNIDLLICPTRVFTWQTLSRQLCVCLTEKAQHYEATVLTLALVKGIRFGHPCNIIIKVDVQKQRREVSLELCQDCQKGEGRRGAKAIDLHHATHVKT